VNISHVNISHVNISHVNISHVNNPMPQCRRSFHAVGSDE